MNAHALGGQRLQDGLDWRADLLGVDAGGVQQKSAPLGMGVGSLGIDAGDVVQQGVQASEPAAAAPVEIREPFQARAGESDAQRVGAVFDAQADASQSAQRVGLEQLVDASVVAQRRHAVVEVGIVRDGDSRLDAADRFAGLHAEAADVSDRSDLLAAPACPMRVRGVLDQRDVGSVHDVEQRVQVGRVAVDVGGHDGAGAVGQLATHVRRVDAEGGRKSPRQHVKALPNLGAWHYGVTPSRYLYFRVALKGIVLNVEVDSRIRLREGDALPFPTCPLNLAVVKVYDLNRRLRRRIGGIPRVKSGHIDLTSQDRTDA